MAFLGVGLSNSGPRRSHTARPRVARATRPRAASPVPAGRFANDSDPTSYSANETKAPQSAPRPRRIATYRKGTHTSRPNDPTARTDHASRWNQPASKRLYITPPNTP